jgi:hypothetical protein
MQKNFQEIQENVLKHEKYSENSKNSRKIPNKIVGAHGKDFRAFDK